MGPEKVRLVVLLCLDHPVSNTVKSYLGFWNKANQFSLAPLEALEV